MFNSIKPPNLHLKSIRQYQLNNLDDIPSYAWEIYTTELSKIDFKKNDFEPLPYGKFG